MLHSGTDAPSFSLYILSELLIVITQASVPAPSSNDHQGRIRKMERVIGTDELKSGERRSVFVDDVPALVIRIESDYFVIEDVCSHDGQPLTNGLIQGCSIICPRHAARFDLRSGQALCMPATEPIRVFRTEIREGAVWAELP